MATMTTSDMEQLIFWSIVLVSYLLRKHPIFGWGWKVIVMLFVGMLVLFLANNTKKNVKSWWNS
jgi:hypothetical protein